MKLTRISKLTGIEHHREIDCTLHQLENWKHGARIEDAFPHLCADDREYIISGITPDEWEATYGTEDEPREPTPEQMLVLVQTRVKQGGILLIVDDEYEGTADAVKSAGEAEKHGRDVRERAEREQSFVRDWDCACGHRYTAPVIPSTVTRNLSGEATQWCPQCGSRPLIGSPAYIPGSKP